MNLSEETIEIIRQHLIRELAVNIIVVFGSGAQGTFRQESDIDLAFFSDSETQEYQLFSTAQTLAALCGREIDLVDLKRASTVFKAQILGKGEVIYSNNPMLFQDLRLRAYKEYALLNEERAEIMGAIAARGYIYDR